jgi:hypothetical protein
MGHALTRRSRSRLDPLFSELLAQLTSAQGLDAPGAARPLGQADAFVLLYSVGGVLRAFIASVDALPPRAELEAALTRLILRCIAQDGEARHA